MGGRTVSRMWNTDSKGSLGWGTKLSFGQDEFEVPRAIQMAAVDRVRCGRAESAGKGRDNPQVGMKMPRELYIFLEKVTRMGPWGWPRMKDGEGGC